MRGSLTASEALRLQDALLDAYISPAFQKKLWAAFAEAGDDPMAQLAAVAGLCGPVEGPIFEGYGFQDMEQMYRALPDELNADRWVAWRRKTIAVLLSPALQQSEAGTGGADDAEKADDIFFDCDTPHPEDAAQHAAWSATPPDAAGGAAPPEDAAQPAAGGAAPPDDAAQPARDSAQPEPCRQIWTVVGGSDAGGILVRESHDLHSQQMGRRLSTGSEVEEVEKKGDRIRFRRLSGDGPESGWVSSYAGGKTLMLPA